MNEELTQSFLLGAFALALILACRSVASFVLGTHRSPVWVSWIFAAAAAAMSAILAAETIGRLRQNEAFPWGALLVSALAMSSLPLHQCAASLRLPARELILRPALWLWLAWSLAACTWSGSRLYAHAVPMPDELASAPRPELLFDSDGAAVSDRGRPIQLFRMQSEVPGWPGGFQGTTTALKRMLQTVICRAEPTCSANCHGWVFAGGKYLIDGRGVQTILDDNGYQRCSDPRPGDLIVYWSGRYIAHSGLVSAVLADGTVLIESKWNLQERFLHLPEHQPYSREFSYYRTARGSHEITILDNRQAAK